MNIEIINQELQFNLFGFSGTAINKDYAGTAFKLMDKMWQVVKSLNLQNKGMNIWVYEPGDKVFAGVELINAPMDFAAMEYKNVVLTHYGYYKHIGPYNLIRQVGAAMNNEIKKKGLESTLPYVEIYGHWNADETKLETELLMPLK